MWVASASLDGTSYLVPLSFDWDGAALLLATPAESVTGKHLAATGAARLGLGDTRDVSMIDGRVKTLEMDELPQERADRFATRTGFDRGLSTRYRWFLISPQRIQARGERASWRELMHEARWLVDV